MKQGLAVSKLNATETVQAERIDEHLKLISEQVNGGLTIANIAPGTKLGLTQFDCFRSIYSLTATANSQASGSFINIGTVIVSSRLIGVGWCIVVGQSTLQRSVTINQNGVAIFKADNLQSKQDLANGSTLCLYGSMLCDYAEQGTAYYSATWTVAAGETMKGTITLMFADQHVA